MKQQVLIFFIIKNKVYTPKPDIFKWYHKTKLIKIVENKIKVIEKKLNLEIMYS